MQATGVTGERQERPLFRPPDVLTALRLPLAAAFVVWDDPAARLVIVIIAALSDFVDGIWARRIGGSRLGSVLDPICDKLFIASAYAVVFTSGLLTPLEVVGVLLRDLLAVFGFLGTWMLRRPTALPARAGGKAVTVCQMLTLVAFLVRPELIRPMAWATAAISVYAAADYGRVFWSR